MIARHPPQCGRRPIVDVPTERDGVFPRVVVPRAARLKRKLAEGRSNPNALYDICYPSFARWEAGLVAMVYHQARHEFPDLPGRYELFTMLTRDSAPR